MSKENNVILYRNLRQQIKQLLTPEFIHELKFGVYTKHFLNAEGNMRFTPEELIIILSAIGEYGSLGIRFPDINTYPMFQGKGLNELLGIEIFLNKYQQKSIAFLSTFGWKKNKEALTADLEYYGYQSTNFVKNVQWAINLTGSDLFGIFWHVGGLMDRNCTGKKLPTINKYQPRVQEVLICLLRVAQGQPTYYQYCGERFPLRENQATFLEFN